MFRKRKWVVIAALIAAGIVAVIMLVNISSHSGLRAKIEPRLEAYWRFSEFDEGVRGFTYQFVEVREGVGGNSIGQACGLIHTDGDREGTRFIYMDESVTDWIIDFEQFDETDAPTNSNYFDEKWAEVCGD